MVRSVVLSVVRSMIRSVVRSVVRSVIRSVVRSVIWSVVRDPVLVLSTPVGVGVFNCQQIVTKITFVIFNIVV